MSKFLWPTELDDAGRLLAVVGSFWSDTYAGNELVQSLLHAKARHHAQAHDDLLALGDSISRFRVPVFHVEDWSPLVLRESALNSPNLPKLDGTYRFDGTIFYDTPVESALFAYPAPVGLVEAPSVFDRIVGPTASRVSGIDFYVKDGAVWFARDPFTDAGAAIVDIFENGVVVDRSLTLWIYRGKFDRENIYNQFGYVLGKKLPSGLAYRKLVNAAYDALVEGTTVRSVQDFVSACCDIPLAAADETVTAVLTDDTGHVVVTPTNAYRVPLSANVSVAVGASLKAGDSICDALVFHEFNRGQAPDGIRALALGRGLLHPAYFREMIFENKTVPLEVVEDVDGYTRVSFNIGGWPGDREKFWDDVHANGVRENATLAMALDTRTNKDGQPTAAALPTTVNPLKFILDNLFRGTLLIVTCRPEAFGPGAIGLHAATMLRRLTPPQYAVVLIVQQSFDDEADPDELMEEEIDVYLGQSLEDEVEITDAEEDLRIFQIGGYCA